MAEVVHLPLEHRDAFHTHTEGESGIFIRINAAGLEHVGVYHTAAHNFQPAGAFADVATLAVADVAAHVHFGRRFREGEVAGTHADFRLRTEHLACEEQDGLLQIRERNVLVNIKALHLVEDAVGAGRDGLVAEYAAGAHHADGKRLRFHGADLHGRRVGAQEQRVQMARAYEESVLHFARRMVGREVQGLKHVVVVLDFRTLGHVVAELAENVHNLLPDDGNRMTGTQGEGIAGHGEVFLGSIGHGRFLCRRFQFLDAGGGGLLQFVQLLTVFTLEFRRHGAELLHQGRDFTFFAQKTDAGFLGFLGRLGLQFVQLFENLFNRFLHIFYFFLFLLSRASFARFPPLFIYFFHCSSVKKRW